MVLGRQLVINLVWLVSVIKKKDFICGTHDHLDALQQLIVHGSSTIFYYIRTVVDALIGLCISFTSNAITLYNAYNAYIMHIAII